MMKYFLLALLILPLYACDTPDGCIEDTNYRYRYSVNESNNVDTVPYISDKQEYQTTPKEDVALPKSNNVLTILPYAGMVNYDKSAYKTYKDVTYLGGLYANYGNLGYLFEFKYSYMNTKYKNSNIENLNQNDIAMTYSKYFKNFMLRGGLHHINTNDIDLGNANLLIAGFGGYNFINYDKFSYGVEGYYSNYKNGHDENYVAKNISVMQLTPYFGYFKTFNINNKNALNLKINYISANDFVKKSYISYSISDTYYYKSLFATINATFGETRTGVVDGGLNVSNSLDLNKNGYGLKLGYYLTSQMILSLSYDISNYIEYRFTQDATKAATVFAFSYTY